MWPATLNEFVTPAVEYRHKYLNRQHISTRKNCCFMLYVTASSEEPLSVTSGLRASIQPAKPIPLISFWGEQLPKSYVFYAHEIFTVFCAPFSYKITHFP